MTEEEYSKDPFVNPSPHPTARKQRFSLLCKLFDHKYIAVEIGPGVIEPECERCGKLRDVHPPKKKYCKECNSLLSINGFCFNKECSLRVIEK